MRDLNNTPFSSYLTFCVEGMYDDKNELVQTFPLCLINNTYPATNCDIHLQ